MLFNAAFITALVAPFSVLVGAAAVVPSLAGSPSFIGGTYPRANYLNDGSILVGWEGVTNGNKQITLSKSLDNGTSWNMIGTASTRPLVNSDLGNPYVLQLPSGRVLCAFRNHDKPNGYTTFRITVTYSDDMGVSWKFLSEIVDTAHGLWEPLLRSSADGRSVQLYYSRENAATDQDSIMRVSTNGGASWGGPSTISGAGITGRDGMIGITSINGGSSLIAVFETTQSGRFTIDSVTSNNDGTTWGNRRRVYTPTGENNNAGAPQVTSIGGTIVVSFMTDEDTGRHRWIDGAGVKLVTSGDGGNTWGNKLAVFAPQANWGGLAALRDSKSFLVLADQGGSKAQRVVLN